MPLAANVWSNFCNIFTGLQTVMQIGAAGGAQPSPADLAVSSKLDAGLNDAAGNNTSVTSAKAFHEVQTKRDQALWCNDV